MKGGKEKDWALGYAKIIQYNKEISLNLINLFFGYNKTSLQTDGCVPEFGQDLQNTSGRPKKHQ